MLKFDSVFVYSYGIPRDARFIRVGGDDGIFYDLVSHWHVKDHIQHLIDGGYTASVARRKDVPNCRFRDFTSSPHAASYRDALRVDAPGIQSDNFYFV